MYSVPVPTDSPATSAVPSRRTPAIVRANVFRNSRHSITSASVSITSWLPNRLGPRGSPGTPACIRRSASATAASFRRASWRSRSHSSTRDSLVPAAAERTTRRSATTVLGAFCFCGTFSPSRRQIRCTRSLPTCHPASRNSGDPPVAVAPVLTAQVDDRSRQCILVGSVDHLELALCPSPLPQQPAGMPLGHSVVLARMPDRTTSPLRA